MPHLLGQFANVPLALSDRAVSRVIGMAGKFNSATINLSEDPNRDCYGNQIKRKEVTLDGTAIIPLIGVVSRGLGPLGEYFGFLDIDKFAKDLEDAIHDETVLRIAVLIDSPGGTVLGTRDAAELLAKAAAVKPVMSYASGMMCSAAYYIGAASGVIFSASSACVGSIGVYTYLMDDSGFWEENGIKWIVIRSGELKGAGIDQLTDKQKSMMQEEIDSLGEEFRTFVEGFRTISREDMEGQTFSGIQSSKRGFVHGIANTFNEALSRFKSLYQPQG